MARAFVLSTMLVVMSGCSDDTTTQAVTSTSEGGVSEGAVPDGSSMSNQESGSTVDMPGDPDAPEPSCSDQILNGDESDVDCGGFCSPCPLHKICRAHSDCASVHCVDTKCLECAPNSHQCSGNKTSSCMDGMWAIANDDCPAGCDLNTGLCIVGSE